MKKLLIIVLILIVAGLVYYFGFYQKGIGQETGSEQTGTGNESGLANPASVYCEEQGGEISIKTFKNDPIADPKINKNKE